MDQPPSARSGLPESDWRVRLRALPVFLSTMPGFDPDAAPDDPMELASAWLGEAIEAGLLQPHAATWATVDGTGSPSSRTLILKDLTHDGFWFATPSDSPMGRDLAGNSATALQFYWREFGRQLRVTGDATPADPAVSTADWEARSPAAKAGADATTWTAYRLAPAVVEFFAASTRRDHLRLVYRRSVDNSWIREQLRP